MVSCSVRWNRMAFSMAMAQGSTSVSSSSRSAWLNLPPRLLMTCDHPDGAPARDEGGAEHGAGLELGGGVEAAREARILGGVVDDGGLARLRHPARDPFPHLHPEHGHVFALLAEGQLEGELLLLLVQHQDGPGLGGDELLDLGHDQLDDLARLQDGVGRLHDVGEDGQAPGGRAQLELGVAGAPDLAFPRARGLEVGQHLARGRVAGAPGAEVEVVAELARAVQDLGVPAQRHAAHRLVGQRPPEGPQSRRRALRPDLDERPLEVSFLDTPPRRPGRREELEFQTVGVAGVEILPQGGAAEDRHPRPHVTRPPSPTAGSGRPRR